MRRKTNSDSGADTFAGVQKLVAAGRPQQALRWLRDPRTGRIRKPFHQDLNRAWYLAGEACYRLGRLNEAQAAFKRALRYRRDDVEALAAIAACYDELCKPIIAERYLRRALLIDGTRADFLYRLGNALFDQARYFEAASVYRRVPGTATATSLRARRNYEMALKLSATD